MDLITQRLKLVDVNKSAAAFFGEQLGVKADDVEFIRKGILAGDVQFDEGERAAVSYITTRDIDRDGEIVDPNGADLEAYRKNPVVLFGHDYASLPVGKNIWIKQDDRGLIAKTVYANHEFAQTVYNYRKDGFPLAQSIGFIPLEWDDNPGDVKGCRRRYRKWALLEYSDVAVPANPEAIGIAVSKGLLKNVAVEKILYNGLPSVFDIFDAVDIAINPNGIFTYWVSDVYPYNYPNGEAIVGKRENGVILYFSVPYTYSDGVADVGLMTPMKMEWTEKQHRFFNERDLLEEKSGKVLSQKNRTLIMAAVQQMDEASEALRDLLAATEPAETDEPDDEETEKTSNDQVEVKEKENMEGKTPTPNPEPASKKQEISKSDLADVLKSVMKQNRVDIAGIIDETVARRLGRATLD